MNRTSLLTACMLVLLAVPLSSPLLAAPSDPLAFVSGFTGRVEVTRSPSRGPEQVTLGLPLRRGDKLQVGAGGAATLLFNDGNVLELPERSAFTIGAHAAGKKAEHPPDELMAGVFKSVSQQSVVGGSHETGLVALAPVRGGTPEVAALILAPRQTEVLESRPAFRWRKVGGATRYRVALSGDNGKVWEREVQDTALSYPADVAELQAGSDYVWELQALSETGSVRHEESAFHVKSEADAAVIRRHVERIEKSGESDSRGFLAGAYLASQGLLGDASARFETLCASHPEDPGLHEALGRIYRAVGLTGEAASELQKALTMSRKP